MAMKAMMSLPMMTSLSLKTMKMAMMRIALRRRKRRH
jgi:hypothetical protein